MKFQYYTERIGENDYICIVPADRDEHDFSNDEHAYVHGLLPQGAYEKMENIFCVPVSEGGQPQFNFWGALKDDDAFEEGARAKCLFKDIEDLGYMEEANWDEDCED